MPVIEVSGLTKAFRTYKKQPGFSGAIKGLFHRHYEQTVAVNEVSFKIEPGELVGFLGPNGAGKTTTLKMLAGLLYPTGGAAKVLGHTPWERHDDYRRQFALVLGQKNQLWWDLPAIDSFLLNKEIYEISDEQYKKTLAELTELLDVADILQVQVRKLSLGQRMKCELIAALIHTPKVLFLDEPTIGLDVVMQQKLRDFIKQYNKRYSATILLTSHYMKDVEQLCERIIIIDHGKVLYDGSLADIVKKYAKNKAISVVFEKPVEKDKLERLGKIIEMDGTKVVLSVLREKSSHVAATLLDKFPVDDLNIEEPNIEEIIRDVFSKQASSST